MMMHFLIPGFILFYIMVTSCDARRKEGFCSKVYHGNSDCPKWNFFCKNGKCIRRELFKNGRDDCGDNSDEMEVGSPSACHSSMKPCYYAYYEYRSYTCVPILWFCDGISDCRKGEDEIKCNVQAFVVMALACTKTQPGKQVDSDTLDELVMELKQHQYRNGTVENLQTTALVLQALIAADQNPDPETFDEIKALQQIYGMQQSDGSFGSLLDTYYVLSVLHCRSLVNISTDHCQFSERDETSALEGLSNRSGPKIRVRYSLWIGDDKDSKSNIALRVPANLSFYGTVELAAEVDTRYRSEYIVKNGKPYVNAISDIKDNPEKNMFWFLYTFVEGKPVPSQESPVDVVPKEHQHFLMWYRSGSWME